VTPEGWWRDRRVLVTGHTGFKGAWLAHWLRRLGAEVSGLSLAPGGPESAFAVLAAGSEATSCCDLRAEPDVQAVVERAQPEVVFHLGAQALVRRGWAAPAETYAVNVVGTSHLLEAVARTGTARAVVVVTSDKVYENREQGVPFAETAPLGGSDPYSASKAAVEHVVCSWRRAHPEIPVATVRAGNVIGGGDEAVDRLLPDAWRALRAGEPLLVRDPEARRPWQFVLDPLAGYLMTAHLLRTDPDGCPPALNFGPPPEDSWRVCDVVDAVLGAWGSGRRIGGPPGPTPAEASELRLDSSLAAKALAWQTRVGVPAAIEMTVDWWKAVAAGESPRELADRQIAAYERLWR
jgi:CDP-glucose 4,6-dehydratase